MMGEGRRVFLYVAYPTSVVWKDYSTKKQLATWIEITTVILDEDNFYIVPESYGGHDSRKVEVKDTIGFGCVAGDTTIITTLASLVDMGVDRAWKVTG